MTDRGFDYPALVRDALRGVVRNALEQVASTGLPGEHHFYITFRTTEPGVEMPTSLWRRHPEEMTIVLQHQFWNLDVGAEEFNVTLRFGGEACDLTVPFAAITSFVDPEEKFGLNFEPEAGAEEEPVEPADLEGRDSSQPNDGEGASAPVVSLDDFRKT